MTETAVETPRKPLRLDDGDDLARVLDDHEYVLVDFYTKGCSLCQSIEPVLGNVARAREDVTVAMLNPRDDPPLIQTYNIRSAPTLVLFADGEEVGRLAEGFQGGDAIDAFLDGHFGD